jgi:hypothetical protein
VPDATDLVSYCRRWNFRRHRPIDPLTPEEALARDVARELYTVVLADPTGHSTPEAVIEIAWENDHAGVWFFDEFGRQKLNYAFRREGDSLFLHDIIEYTYPDDSPATLSGAIRTDEFSFSTDGTAQRVIADEVLQEKTTETRGDIDVSTHWEPVPKFGEWGSLARYHRSQPIA